jgi:hypothetical protein
VYPAKADGAAGMGIAIETPDKKQATIRSGSVLSMGDFRPRDTRA